MTLSLFLRAAQLDHLRAVVLGVWTAIHPALPLRADAAAIADAIAWAVAFDPAPVGGGELEAAAMGYWAFAESSLVRRAVGDAGASWGVWQEPRAVGSGPLDEQARYWLRLLHAGELSCPESPAAPLSGGCVAARRVADRRMARVREILAGLEL